MRQRLPLQHPVSGTAPSLPGVPPQAHEMGLFTYDLIRPEARLPPRERLIKHGLITAGLDPGSEAAVRQRAQSLDGSARVFVRELWRVKDTELSRVTASTRV